MLSAISSRPRAAASRRCGVERRGQQRVGARRLGQRDGAVDDVLVEALPAEVQHRRLAEAADDLVRARDHEVGAGGERVLGQQPR